MLNIKQASICGPIKGKGPAVLDYVTTPKTALSVVENMRRWTAPPENWVKLNTDGSWSANGSAGAWIILRDGAGDIIYSSCRTLYSCRDAMEAELCACKEGLSLSLQRSKLPIVLEMHSSSVLNLLKDEGPDRSVFVFSVAEIKYLLSLHKTCITLIKRSQNIVADYLANFARTKNRIVVWLGSGPP